MRVTCTDCGGDHPKWDCKRPVKKSEHAGNGVTIDQVGRENAPWKKSTAARRGVSQAHQESEVAEQLAGKMGRSPEFRVEKAGTQALPIDTNSEKGRVFAAPLGLASPANASDAKTANTKDATKFDKKAWMRDYMREYMRKIRAK